MLTHATPPQLAALDGLVRAKIPPSFSAALDAAEVHADTVAGKYTTEGLGRYCRAALPMLLRRLVAVEAELLAVRGKVAGHVAEYDTGDDPSPRELLEDLQRAGVDLRADVETAVTLLEAKAHTAAMG